MKTGRRRLPWAGLREEAEMDGEGVTVASSVDHETATGGAVGANGHAVAAVGAGARDRVDLVGGGRGRRRWGAVGRALSSLTRLRAHVIAGAVGATAGAIVPVGIITRCSFGATGGALAIAALVDVRTHRLPNRLVAIAAAAAVVGTTCDGVITAARVASSGAPPDPTGGVLHGAVSGMTGGDPAANVATRIAVTMVAALVGAVGGALMAGLPMLVVHLSRGVGMGDVKAAAAIGASAALVAWWAAPLACAVAALGAAAFGAVARRPRVALGPCLVVGWWTAVVVAAVTTSSVVSSARAFLGELSW
ncbi:MAG: hypothetical protein ACO3C1_09605 [Ilumatobacteraceae bacterium]